MHGTVNYAIALPLLRFPDTNVRISPTADIYPGHFQKYNIGVVGAILIGGAILIICVSTFRNRSDNSGEENK